MVRTEPQPNSFLKSLDETNVLRLDFAELTLPVEKRQNLLAAWNLADENSLPLEMKQALNANGIKVGVFNRSAPDELLELLISKKYCPNPRRIHAQMGKQAIIPGSLQEKGTTILLEENGHQRNLELKQTVLAFFVTPQKKREGLFHLLWVPTCTPVDQRATPKAVKSSTGNFEWDLQEDKKSGMLNALAWTMEIQPGDFILIGANHDKKDHIDLGNCFFQSPSGKSEKLIVVRCSQKPQAVSKNLGQFDNQIPLALQAAWSDVEKSLRTGN
ncbi:MAG: hypothetical protein EXR99_01215 [Gemmataceae bacterium]|nr:hypothetical protein [Gemmataceae bacterium]